MYDLQAALMPWSTTPWESVPSTELDLGYEVAFPFFSQAEPSPATPSPLRPVGEPVRAG